MANIPRLAPEDQFPKEAISESVQVQPDPNVSSALNAVGTILTFMLASTADQITPWGRNPMIRDRQLRDFWPTESYLAGSVASVSFRNAAFDKEIKHKSKQIVRAVTDMLDTAIAGDMIGWVPFINRLSVDLYTQDNGAFIEVIRDPGMDADSRFKGSMAPVIGISNLDSNQCMRTGNAEFPVIYTDRESREHKLAWYEVICLSDLPSPIEKMNGIGVCSVSRALRLSQIMRSIALFKDEKIGGRNPRALHIVGGVSRSELDQATKRSIEQANNKGQMRYIDPIVLASLDPEKPVSSTTLELASLPDGFDLDQEMQWYIAGLALDFGTDYQEFAPLPSGNIGSSSQSFILNRKSSGKGPRTFMDTLSGAFSYYGVLPRDTKLVFNDKNEQEESERQEIRTKAAEEAAIIVNSKIFPPEVVAKSLVRRGIYEQDDFDNTPPEWWTNALKAAENEAKGQPVGNRGGNTIGEDAGRTSSGKSSQTVGDRLRKVFGG